MAARADHMLHPVAESRPGGDHERPRYKRREVKLVVASRELAASRSIAERRRQHMVVEPNGDVNLRGNKQDSIAAVE